jgi:purine-cytosine permease-like protein
MKEVDQQAERSMSQSKIEVHLPAGEQLQGDDHTGDIVPLSERRGPITMGLLWVTMVTGFPSVLIGFDWYKAGLSLSQMLACIAVSCLLLLAYSIPAGYMGVKSGQTFGLLSRNVFGRWGSRLVSANMVWLSISWYGLNAVLLTEAFKGLFHLQGSTIWLTVVLAVLMAFNNLFGFNGVANFARFFAAPVLIAWVCFTFVKALGGCPPNVMQEVSHISSPAALTLVSSFIIGYSIWGNEADYWRYGKQSLPATVTPLVVSIILGQVIFPVTGWMMARVTGVTDYAAATDLMTQYAFGGMSIIAAVVLVVTYFAVNDSCLYGSINALENIRPFPRKQVVTGVMLAGITIALFLSQRTNALDLVASLSAIFLPSATVIIIAEWLLAEKVFGRPLDFTRVPSFEELPACRWSAVTAFLVGCAVGVLTSGLIPTFDAFHVGVSSLQAWLTALLLYAPLRIVEHRREVAHRQQLEKLLPSVTRD